MSPELDSCPAGRAPCAGGGHFVTYVELSRGPPDGRQQSHCDHREHHREAHTCHEVTARRAVRQDRFQSKVGDPVAEEGEDEAGDGEGDLLAGEVACAAGGHAGDERDAEGEAGEEAADVGEVVDADADVDDHGAEADDQVDGGELDDAASAGGCSSVPGEREPAVGEQDDEDAGDAEDGSRGPGADLEEGRGFVDRRRCRTTFQAMLSRLPAMPVSM